MMQPDHAEPEDRRRMAEQGHGSGRCGRVGRFRATAASTPSGMPRPAPNRMATVASSMVAGKTRRDVLGHGLAGAQRGAEVAAQQRRRGSAELHGRPACRARVARRPARRSPGRPPRRRSRRTGSIGIMRPMAKVRTRRPEQRDEDRARLPREGGEAAVASVASHPSPDAGWTGAREWRAPWCRQRPWSMAPRSVPQDGFSAKPVRSAR